MKFLLDAQLPRRLAFALKAADHDALHTLDLPLGNATPDEELLCLQNADLQQLIMQNLAVLESAFRQHHFVELNRSTLTIHS